MTWSSLWYGIADILEWTFGFLQENVMGNIVNYTIILGILFGLTYWMFVQKKLIEKAKNDPNQLK